jgi:hypothetical protein
MKGLDPGDVVAQSSALRAAELAATSEDVRSRVTPAPWRPAVHAAPEGVRTVSFGAFWHQRFLVRLLEGYWPLIRRSLYGCSQTAQPRSRIASSSRSLWIPPGETQMRPLT